MPRTKKVVIPKQYMIKANMVTGNSDNGKKRNGKRVFIITGIKYPEKKGNNTPLLTITRVAKNRNFKIGTPTNEYWKPYNNATELIWLNIEMAKTFKFKGVEYRITEFSSMKPEYNITIN